MFTGIIEDVGQIISFSPQGYGYKIKISFKKQFDDLKISDSIAVDGVCLTVTKINGQSFEADISKETVSVTTFKHLKAGMKVNLERAMKHDSRFGGHIVLGHVDAVGKIASIKSEKLNTILTVEFPLQLKKYIAHKGSIAINGISLTIAAVKENSFDVALIPLTIKETSLSDKKVGSLVNIEVDVISRYIENLLKYKD
ncbi:riboflavin synthase, alpha subunit [Thermodesulfobium narugense DSM 14796]|uniref:Riboflavin synthase n=1 Tax=Thermodesulfobium narugense DSM 14796 TaxID=747365 RepID=M1E8V5_9BACT|nr:riboflavin synthase [Thermodesulfobium narugense]AEE15388.1 riboflavin synthase, alpha subunit [Thermodesulfobium narugense DSM 14796]